jgi:Family of unknown function (DUF5990)
MRIEIHATQLPGAGRGPSPQQPDGHRGIHVAVQRRGRLDELLGLVRGDAESASWSLECAARRTADGIDLTGPYIQGRPGGRFIYLSWGTVESPGTFTMFRRAKLMLDGVDHELLDAAVASGVLSGQSRPDRRGRQSTVRRGSPAVDRVVGGTVAAP